MTTKPLAGTYESPGKVQEKRIHYADVEHSKSPRPGGKKLVKHPDHNSHHPNFLSDQVDSTSSSEGSNDDDDDDDDENDDEVGQSLVKKSGGLQASGTYHEIEMGTMQGIVHSQKHKLLYVAMYPVE